MRRYALQMAEGVRYCHSMGVAHRDLKPENLLLFDNRSVLKLADFGLAMTLPDSSATVPPPNGPSCTTMCGTLEYVAPEVMSGAAYKGFPADVWSFAVCVYT